MLKTSTLPDPVTIVLLNVFVLEYCVLEGFRNHFETSTKMKLCITIELPMVLLGFTARFPVHNILFPLL
jgi:hypothetical protein